MSNNVFKKKAYKRVNVGAWTFEWFIDERRPERSFMRVFGESGLFDLRISSSAHVFGYLLAAAEQNKLDNLHGWITLVFVPAMAMTQEQGLTDDVTRAVNKWMKRREAEGRKAAKAVTEADEQADQALMEDVVSEQGMGKKELAEKRAEETEIMREILTGQE